MTVITVCRFSFVLFFPYFLRLFLLIIYLFVFCLLITFCLSLTFEAAFCFSLIPLIVLLLAFSFSFASHMFSVCNDTGWFSLLSHCQNFSYQYEVFCFVYFLSIKGRVRDFLMKSLWQNIFVLGPDGVHR